MKNDKRDLDYLVIMPPDEFGYQVVIMRPNEDFLDPLGDFESLESAQNFIDSLE
jgi:hypothetical protein